MPPAMTMPEVPRDGRARTEGRAVNVRAAAVGVPAHGEASGSGLILAVETSCDETAVAVVDHGRRIRASVVASQVAMHAATGGIVPEVAARAHLRWIVPVFEEARAGAGIDDWSAIEAVAVTYGPGLAGSLLVGINFAKTLAYVHGLPLVPVNHLEGHIYAAWLLDPEEPERPSPPFPLIALVVSGGHTFLVEMRDHLDYRFLGQTVDDAAGEAFDKVGRLLGLSYPGGPAIMKAAAGAERRDVEFPRAWMGDSYDFSFSGLKTAARRAIEARGGTDALEAGIVAELAYGFQESVVDVLATKTGQAAERSGARAIVLGGGVAANAVLRDRVAARAADLGIPLIVPRPALCTDNAAMIGAAGFFRARAGTRASLDLDARPSLPLVR
jgi:tRNA N6-adenosine threonylcarbamoyltransferase